MIRIRSLLLAGCSLAFCGSYAGATDFYVKPVKAGPVAGAPIGVVTLQAATTTAGATDTTSTFKRLRTTVNERGNTAGKWVRATDVAATGETAPTATTTAGTTTSTATTTNTTTAAATTTTATATSTTATLAATVAAPAPGAAWNTLDELIRSGKVKGGDRILLMGGSYGTLNIMNAKFTSPVTIEPVPGQVAHAEFLVVRTSSNLKIQGIKVWALSQNYPISQVVRTYGDTSNITLDNMDVRATTDSGNYMSWPASTWLNNKRSGFMLDGANITLKNSRATGVYHGILAQGPNAIIENNIIDGFGGDGMRALGDNSLVKGNKVQNCFAFDANHDDGFQSYSRSAAGKPGSGVVKGLTIVGNKFVEWNSASTSPMRCKLQGIGMFDGMYDDVKIENNLIATSAFHGITIAGGRRVLIANNTVTNINGTTPGYPWIRVAYHKNGTPGSDVIVANNLAMIVKPIPANFPNSLATNNVTIVPARDFVSTSLRDYRLATSSLAGDAGTAKYSPTTDIVNAARPKGKGPDAGAYESR